jgi:hypothetical protein
LNLIHLFGARSALSAAIESQDVIAISITITVHRLSPASGPAPKFFRPADKSSYKLSFVFTVEISALRLPLTHGKTYLLWKQQIKQSGAKTINRLLQKLPEALDFNAKRELTGDYENGTARKGRTLFRSALPI